MRYVVCAALRKGDQVVAGPRHFDSVMRSQISARTDDAGWAQAEQGFIDQMGEFMTRVEAYTVASAANQIRRPLGGPAGVLYSEHLY